MDYKDGPNGRVYGPGKDELTITKSDGGNKVAEWECEKIHGLCQALGIDLAKINSLTAVPEIDPKYSHKIWKQFGWKFNFSFQEESMVLKATKGENGQDIDVYVTLETYENGLKFQNVKWNKVGPPKCAIKKYVLVPDAGKDFFQAIMTANVKVKKIDIQPASEANKKGLRTFGYKSV